MAGVNEGLRTAMIRTGITAEELALCCGVDVKTAERWISPGRVPHRTHRWAAARRLGHEESYLWPDVRRPAPGRAEAAQSELGRPYPHPASAPREGGLRGPTDAAPRRLGHEESYLWPDVRRPAAARAEAAQSELVRLYPDRASVPREVWLRMLTDAAAHIDVLVFSGTFYTQTQPRVAAMLAGAASRGVEVRLCFGDPASDAVATRDREEGLGGTLAAKIRSALTYYRPLAGLDGCQRRLHAPTLYASPFRYDDEIMANPHAYGEPASAHPTLHLPRLDGGQVAE